MNSLDLTFAALADPTRRAILARLTAGETTVGELAAPFSISGPAISRHLRVLEAAALITSRRDRQHRRCALVPGAMASAAEWIVSQQHFWNGSFDKLEVHLTNMRGKPDVDGLK